ncbi:hypothetical protein B0T18DRAFT_195816 [Schizothecium vesticola]|uniref:Uncharacterized protein n=1 Tax=Schizothecium vesticola TaxID=314040 RepID=A0AA40ERA3_9PEZI|nr:hypothetical protein B0T18DRAFT_195816 [Schizothecium vesticola]
MGWSPFDALHINNTPHELTSQPFATLVPRDSGAIRFLCPAGKMVSRNPHAGRDAYPEPVSMSSWRYITPGLARKGIEFECCWSLVDDDPNDPHHPDVGIAVPLQLSTGSEKGVWPTDWLSRCHRDIQEAFVCIKRRRLCLALAKHQKIFLQKRQSSLLLTVGSPDTTQKSQEGFLQPNQGRTLENPWRMQLVLWRRGDRAQFKRKAGINTVETEMSVQDFVVQSFSARAAGSLVLDDTVRCCIFVIPLAYIEILVSHGGDCLQTRGEFGADDDSKEPRPTCQDAETTGAALF